MDKVVDKKLLQLEIIECVGGGSVCRRGNVIKMLLLATLSKPPPDKPLLSPHCIIMSSNELMTSFIMYFWRIFSVLVLLEVVLSGSSHKK